MRHLLLSSGVALFLLGAVALSPAQAQWRRGYVGNYYYPSYYPSYSSYYTVPSTSYYSYYPSTSAVTVETPVYVPPVTTYVPPVTSYYYTPSYNYSYPYYTGYSAGWRGWRWR